MCVLRAADSLLSTMAEDSLNLSLDDIIKKNAENTKKKSGGGGRASTRGRGGRSSGRGDRGSSLRPNNLSVQRQPFKVVRGGRGQSRGAARVSTATISTCLIAGATCCCFRLEDVSLCN